MKELKEITDKKLFLTYGYTCAGSAMQRGVITEKDVKIIRDYVVNGIKPKKDYTSAFPMARIQMSRLAEKEHQEVIDSKLIREYFHEDHNDIVLAPCRTYAGVVKKIRKNRAYVETVMGTKSYWTNLVRPQVNSRVIVHRGYVVEIISKREAERLFKKNAKYAK